MSQRPRATQVCRYLVSACAAACLIGVAPAHAASGSGSSSASGAHASGKSAGKAAAKSADQLVKVPDSSRNIIKTPTTAPRIKLQPIDPAPHASQMPTTAEPVPHHLDKSISPLLKKDSPPFKGVGDGPRGGVLSKERMHSGPTVVPRQIEPDAPPPYRSIIRKKPQREMMI